MVKKFFTTFLRMGLGVLQPFQMEGSVHPLLVLDLEVCALSLVEAKVVDKFCNFVSHTFFCLRTASTENDSNVQ